MSAKHRPRRKRARRKARLKKSRKEFLRDHPELAAKIRAANQPNKPPVRRRRRAVTPVVDF